MPTPPTITQDNLRPAERFRKELAAEQRRDRMYATRDMPRVVLPTPETQPDTRFMQADARAWREQVLNHPDHAPRFKPAAPHI